ncbi:MAG: SAM-dependent methyltransferase [Candidatus Binatia bacterium]
MRQGEPSYTAMAAASARAAHTSLYGDVRIFVDDLAARLIGFPDRDALRAVYERVQLPTSPARIAAFFALRHRWAEDRLALAVERGVRQLVLLGAGLDTLALRRPDLTERIRVFEVDHPDTQRWKRARLEELGLAAPHVTYVPVDFEREQLADRLAESGVRLDEPLFVTWLGVVHYLARPAIDAVFRLVLARPPGSEVVFDFIVRHDLVADDEERALSEQVEANSAARGEPWLTFVDPETLPQELHAMGFTTVERLTPELAASRYYGGQPDRVTPLTAWQAIAASR